jgi:hypothetical protein
MRRGRPGKKRPEDTRSPLTPLENQLSLLRSLEAFIREENYKWVAFTAEMIQSAAENELKRQIRADVLAEEKKPPTSEKATPKVRKKRA